MNNNTKEWVQYGSAIAMLASGIVLTFISFFIYGDVTSHVLYYVGECLLYCGGVVGISTYAKTTIKDEMSRIKNMIDDAKEG